MFEVKIYIETSLKGPLRAGEGEGWYAAVVEYRKKDGEIETREDFVRDKKTTYHKSVLCAFLKSLKRLNKECVLEVHTDSTFLNNNCKNGNLEMWKTNGWKTIKGENVAHKELWQQISTELDKHKVEFVWERRNEYSKWMMEQAKIRLKSPTNAEKSEIGGQSHG